MKEKESKGVWRKNIRKSTRQQGGRRSLGTLAVLRDFETIFEKQPIPLCNCSNYQKIALHFKAKSAFLGLPPMVVILSCGL